MVKILCVADNKYVETYRPCIDSQNSFAQKFNYEYMLITGEKGSRNWKRSKIDELEFLLESTTDDIVLIDGDCLIKDTCPAFSTFITDTKSIYYANGKSGRLNSGFLYFKNDDHSLAFVKELKEKLKLPVPKGKGFFVTSGGENGHIIWTKTNWEKEEKDVFQEISKLWNCSSQNLKNKAYILHFTNDLRKEIYKYNENLRPKKRNLIKDIK